MESPVELGAFRLDPERLLLLRGEEAVPLGPKAVQLLVVLAEARGAVVSKEELTRRLWPDVFTTPGNLHQCVAMARRALGERPGGGEWIETVPRAGYRLAGIEAESAGTVSAEAPRTTRARLGRTAIAAALLLAAGGGALLLRARARAQTCATGEPTAAPGYRVSSWVTGFPHWREGGCQGVLGMAVSHDGDVFAVGEADGHLYRFGARGGAADARTRVTSERYPAAWCPNGLAFSRDGRRLYMARQFCGVGGDVVEVSPEDGHVVREVATAIPCATGLATDPVSGDLFVSTPCPAGTDHVYRISAPESPRPGVTIYASPGGALGLAFAPDGTLWTEAFRFDLSTRYVVRIAGTSAPDAGAFRYVTSDPLVQDANAVVPTDDPSVLFVLRESGIARLELADPPRVVPVTSSVASAILMIAAPDGCLLADAADRIIRLSAADGSCRLPLAAASGRSASAARPAFTARAAR